MYQQQQSDRSGPYRSRNGIFFGVCRGLADYFDFSIFWMRVLFVLTFIFTGLYPVGIGYIIAALIMKPEPVLPLENDGDREFYNSYTTSRPMALSRLKTTFDNLDKRIQRMESIVTARDYDWDQRLRNS
jgi:phage shock protein C